MEIETIPLPVIFFVGPLIESFAGQLLPIIMGGFIIKNKYLLILLSSTIFALGHRGSFFLPSFAIGLVLATSFVVQKKKSLVKAYVLTTSIHIVHNLMTSFLQYVILSVT